MWDVPSRRKGSHLNGFIRVSSNHSQRLGDAQGRFAIGFFCALCRRILGYDPKNVNLVSKIFLNLDIRLESIYQMVLILLHSAQTYTYLMRYDASNFRIDEGGCVCAIWSQNSD